MDKQTAFTVGFQKRATQLMEAGLNFADEIPDGARRVFDDSTLFGRLRNSMGNFGRRAGAAASRAAANPALLRALPIGLGGLLGLGGVYGIRKHMIPRAERELGAGIAKEDLMQRVRRAYDIIRKRDTALSGTLENL